MLRSILIGLDSSASGIAAQELGVQWGQQLGCRLVGLAIVDSPVFPLTEAVMYGGVSGRVVSSTLVVEPRVKVAVVPLTVYVVLPVCLAVSPLEMTDAYATFADHGMRHDPQAVASVRYFAGIAWSLPL